MDKVIFCIFLNSDWNIYAEYLQFYFPCEEILQKEERNKSKAASNKESARKDEEGTDDLGDVPDADLNDLLAMVQKENKDRTQKDDEASKLVEGMGFYEVFIVELLIKPVSLLNCLFNYSYKYYLPNMPL